MERCKWDSELPNCKQYETLFHNTNQIESLTVVDNESVALKRYNGNYREMSYDYHDIKIRNQIEMVVLNYERDANKISDEMNGGMAHVRTKNMPTAVKQQLSM